MWELTHNLVTAVNYIMYAWFHRSGYLVLWPLIQELITAESLKIDTMTIKPVIPLFLSLSPSLPPPPPPQLPLPHLLVRRWSRVTAVVGVALQRDRAMGRGTSSPSSCSSLWQPSLATSSCTTGRGYVSYWRWAIFSSYDNCVGNFSILWLS